MKKLLVLILLSSSVLANSLISNEVMKKSISMDRYQWMNECLQERRNLYCSGKKCPVAIESKWRNICWNFYPKAQYYAYRAKETGKDRAEIKYQPVSKSQFKYPQGASNFSNNPSANNSEALKQLGTFHSQLTNN